MIWQDAIFTVGSLMFMVALYPSIVGPDKPALLTSVMTGGILYAFAGTYVTLGLTFASVSTFGTALMWTLLAIQKARQC